jgi:hypothetical protein
MKNIITTITPEDHCCKIIKRSSLIILSLIFLFGINMQAGNDESACLANGHPSSATIEDPYFSDIINKINMGHFFNATVTTLNEKTKGKEIDVYSSYGFTQDVNKLHNGSIELKNLSTSFSDRSHFSGSKTVETIVITDNGRKVNVEVTFVTWSNTKTVLTNVALKKINKVTFLTGYVLNGSNATYYTIALQDMGTIN